MTSRRLREHGIERLVDVRTADASTLREAVGSMTDWLLHLARGEDDREVTPNRPSKSSSSECTYSHDLVDIDRMREEVALMARDNAEWLAEKGLLARTVTLKVRYDDFTTITRSDTRRPTSDPDEIQGASGQALRTRPMRGNVPVRLLGAGVHNIGEPEETDEDGQAWLPFE